MPLVTDFCPKVKTWYTVWTECCSVLYVLIPYSTYDPIKIDLLLGPESVGHTVSDIRRDTALSPISPPLIIPGLPPILRLALLYPGLLALTGPTWAVLYGPYSQVPPEIIRQREREGRSG